MIEQVQLSPDTILRFDVYDGWFSLIDTETGTETILPIRDTGRVITGIGLIRQRLMEREISTEELAAFNPKQIWEMKYLGRPVENNEDLFQVETSFRRIAEGIEFVMADKMNVWRKVGPDEAAKVNAPGVGRLISVGSHQVIFVNRHDAPPSLFHKPPLD